MVINHRNLILALIATNVHVSVGFTIVQPSSKENVASSLVPSSSSVGALPTKLATTSYRNIALSNSESDGEEPSVEGTNMSEEEVKKVGNLVVDDEWMGLSMELSELVRVAVIEETKKNMGDFLGKEDYEVGDISKEIDSRVKGEIAKMRGKEDYQLGDLSMALDTLSKDMTCSLTGKDEYEFGDLSNEIDTRIKSKVSEYCGKDTYEFGDLSREVDKRAQVRVIEFIGKEEYEFGDISKEIENRRRAWVTDFLGEEAAKDYEFGDITKKALSNITGKDEYEFGDVTKKVLGDLFGKRKRGGGSN